MQSSGQYDGLRPQLRPARGTHRARVGVEGHRALTEDEFGVQGVQHVTGAQLRALGFPGAA